MKTVKILHTADVHIGAAQSFLGVLAEKRRFETLITFEKIVDLADAQSVHILLIAGDLFDSNEIEDRFFDAVISKIGTVPHIKVVYCAGNHDPMSSESPLLQRAFPENFYMLGKKDDCITFEGLGTKVYGRSFEQPFLEGEERFSLETDENYINILLQHGELRSDMNSEYNAITPAFVKNCGMDYIALGHVHKKTAIGKMGKTHFAYSGCPEGQGFDELDEKGVYIGEIGKDFCELEFVSVSKRLHIEKQVDISGCKSNIEITEKIINQLSSELGENYGDNLYKIELTGELSEDTELDKAEIISRLSETLYFVKLKVLAEPKIDYVALSKEVSLKGIFARKMLEKMESVSDEEKEIYKNALKLGIKAFKTEVKYDED